jgi:septal ring factor EnvC (AmiA/AmiB activator)
MRRLALVICFGLLAAGCATNKAVKKEIDPLAERLTAVERQQATADAKVGQMSAKIDAQTAEIQALRKDVADSTAASREAQQSLHDATMRAETAAQKSTKAFELMQVKGSKPATKK